MQTYELMYIATVENTEAKQKKLLETIKKQITAAGGGIIAEDVWGIKDLAYKIKKQEQGYYTVVIFKLEPEHVKELNDYLKLESDILRFMISIPPTNYQLLSYQEIKKTEELLKKQRSDEIIEKNAAKKYGKPETLPRKKPVSLTKDTLRQPESKIQTEAPIAAAPSDLPKEPQKTPQEIEAERIRSEQKLDAALAKVKDSGKEENVATQKTAQAEKAIDQDLEKKLAEILGDDNL